MAANANRFPQRQSTSPGTASMTATSRPGPSRDTLTQSPRFPIPHFPISLADIQNKAHQMSTTSLALLLPTTAFLPSWQQQQGPGGVTTTTTATTATTTAAPYRPSALAQQLERQSAFLVEAINAHNFSSQVTDHIAPGFRAAIGDFNTTQDLADTTSMMHEHARRAAPGYRVRVVNASADVDERAGAATVFQLLDVLGYTESMRTQAICVLKWARQGDRWLLEALYGMSGLANADG